MRNFFILLMAIISLNSFGQISEKKLTGSVIASNQKHMLKIVNFDELQTILKKMIINCM